MAEVGGLWDNLLADGRKFYNFVSSDYHADTGADFWPGEYLKTYIKVIDTNGDGARDAGEQPLASVTVYLYEDVDGDGVLDADELSAGPTAVTTSSGDGSYVFETGVDPSKSYFVVGATREQDADVPDGYVPPALPVRVDETQLFGGVAVTGVDVGYVASSSISGTVFFDKDGDAVYDALEATIANATVRLYTDANHNGVYDAGVDTLVILMAVRNRALIAAHLIAAGRAPATPVARDPNSTAR